MTLERLRLGIVGCGSMGESHAKAVAEISSAQLVGVFDPDHDRAQAMAHRYEATTAASLEELLGRIDVDAIIVASPTEDHVNATVTSAQSGKHVLVEKPPALALEEFGRMQSACEEAGVVMMVGQTLRFNDVVQAIRDVRDAGQIGRPVYFNWTSNTTRLWPAGWRGWQSDGSQSGGMALHLGIHSIDLALWLLGDVPSRVYAQGSNLASPGLGVYDYLQIAIRCRNGANALLEIHSSLPGIGNTYLGARLIGTNGQAEWNTNEDGSFMSSTGSKALFAGHADSLRKELVHFINCCLGREELLITPHQARNALSTAIAATQSLEQGCAVAISDVNIGGTH